MRVSDILDLIASGASREEILADYEFLEPDDITPALTYEARQMDHHDAEIRADLEAADQALGPLDLLVAEQTRSLKATLVTVNVSAFKRVKGLTVQAWPSV